MHVNVHAGLSARMPNVDADVVAVGSVFLGDEGLRAIEKVDDLDLLRVVISKKFATCRRGTTSTCPRAKLLLS